jgi:hypothetical protein
MDRGEERKKIAGDLQSEFSINFTKFLEEMT